MYLYGFSVVKDLIYTHVVKKKENCSPKFPWQTLSHFMIPTVRLRYIAKTDYEVKYLVLFFMGFEKVEKNCVPFMLVNLYHIQINNPSTIPL